MSKSRFSSADTSLNHQQPISDNDFLQIGRLVRAIAEIEDCLELFICKMSEIDEARLGILLGRTPISKNVGIAQMLAQVRVGVDQEAFEAVFNPSFSAALKVRNTLAHGKYMGVMEDGKLAFLTNNDMIADPDNIGIVTSVSGIESWLIKNCADAFDERLQDIEEMLGIVALRRKRELQSLPPHPKGQNRRKPKQTPQSQP